MEDVSILILSLATSMSSGNEGACKLVRIGRQDWPFQHVSAAVHAAAAFRKIPSVSTGQGAAFEPPPAQPLQTAEAAWLQMEKCFLESSQMIVGFFQDELEISIDLSHLS